MHRPARLAAQLGPLPRPGRPRKLRRRPSCCPNRHPEDCRHHDSSGPRRCHHLHRRRLLRTPGERPAPTPGRTSCRTNNATRQAGSPHRRTAGTSCHSLDRKWKVSPSPSLLPPADTSVSRASAVPGTAHLRGRRLLPRARRNPRVHRGGSPGGAPMAASMPGPRYSGCMIGSHANRAIGRSRIRGVQKPETRLRERIRWTGGRAGSLRVQGR